MTIDRQPTSLRLSDASQQAAAQPWLDLEMHQLSAGNYQGECAALTLDGMHLVYEQQNQAVHKRGVTQGNLCAISMAKSIAPGMRFSQFLSPMNSWIYFLPRDAELDINVAENSETFYLCLDQDALLKDARLLNERYWLELPDGPQAFSSAHTARLTVEFSRMLQHRRSDGPALSANGASMLRDSVLMVLNDATIVDTSDSRFRSGSRTHRLVSTAREYIDASLRTGRVPPMADLCAATGVSERTLQCAFRSILQLTPVAYLRTLRLNRVRADLLTATPTHATVTVIAMHWGFVHLGDFSRDYGRLFGERPSETLAQGSAHSTS